MDGIYDLKEWTLGSIQEVREDGIFESIHIDDIKGFDPSLPLIKSTVALLEELSEILKRLDVSCLSIYLSVELIPKSIHPSRFVNNSNWFEQQILPRSMPEIIVYKPSDSEFIPLVELHRTPLDKRTFQLEGDFNPFFKEDRSLSDVEQRIKLNRELMFIYQKPPNTES